MSDATARAEWQSLRNRMMDSTRMIENTTASFPGLSVWTNGVSSAVRALVHEVDRLLAGERNSVPYGHIALVFVAVFWPVVCVIVMWGLWALALQGLQGL
jgi:hypothetical protein